MQCGAHSYSDSVSAEYAALGIEEMLGVVHTCCDRQRNDTGCVVEEVELLVRWLAASIVWCALYLCVLHTDRSRHSLCNCEMITNQSDSEQKFDTTHRVRCWLRLP